jgi:tetratricopeptide (TPR) repeat protein
VGVSVSPVVAWTAPIDAECVRESPSMHTKTFRTLLLLTLAATLPDAARGQSAEIGPAPRLWELRAIDTLILQEEYDIAVKAARELARQTEQLHGPKYLGLADIHGMLGTALRKQGRLPEARIAFEKTLELRKHNLGELSGLSIIAMRDLAGLHREAGRLDDARKLAERARDLVERIPLGTGPGGGRGVVRRACGAAARRGAKGSGRGKSAGNGAQGPDEDRAGRRPGRAVVPRLRAAHGRVEHAVSQ